MAPEDIGVRLARASADLARVRREARDLVAELSGLPIHDIDTWPMSTVLAYLDLLALESFESLVIRFSHGKKRSSHCTE